MVNIQKYQIVAVGDTVNECVRNYENLMENNGVNITESGEKLNKEGVITMLKDIVVDANTYYYVMVENDDMLYSLKAGDHVEILKKNTGDRVVFEYVETNKEGVNTITDIIE